MNPRPEYFSNRGATTSDLNDKILENIYKGIQNEYGDNAANQFAQMVAKIPKLSATDFLLSLYRLEGNNWNWDEKILGNEKGIYATDEGTAMGTLFAALSGMNKRDETKDIRREFLKRHKIDPEYDENINPFLELKNN